MTSAAQRRRDTARWDHDQPRPHKRAPRRPILPDWYIEQAAQTARAHQRAAAAQGARRRKSRTRSTWEEVLTNG